ncbi:MAG: carboxylating nicotinate-nucleotide diphosphorylase [Calditerrivibrio sp.]|nr:carboxylating nicotinate-nucleotide diphosphorylase [Calditerrivibrio sp.]
MIFNHLLDKLIDLALEEDIGVGDISTSTLDEYFGYGVFDYKAKENFILCGIDVAKRVFNRLDPDIKVTFNYKDGTYLKKGDIFGTIEGKVSSILKGERVSLNFLQRLSGIATNTRRFIDELKDTNIKIIDTRKTLPGHRILEKYAVRTGGGFNHRFGLFDGVMLKDNHIDALGGITKAIAIIRENIPITIKIEVETRTLDEVKEAVKAGADIIMLDNFDIDNINEASKIICGRAKIEVSGGVNIDNIKLYRNLPIDYISIGALTHQARSVDINLKLRSKL